MRFCVWLLLGLIFAFSARAANSTWVYQSPSGNLLSKPDTLGNRIPDFSNCGYQGGGVAIPDVPVKTNISPVIGDNGSNIQNAINYVASLPMDSTGFRGAVLLSAGEYPIAGSIYISTSGIVLRGAGSGTNGTILRDTGTNADTLIRITGVSGQTPVAGTTNLISDYYVPVGARSFNLASTNGLAVGDQVTVFRPSTLNWIQYLGMDLLGPTNNGDYPWQPGDRDLRWDRTITAIEGNRVMLDVPLTCAIEQQYGGGMIWKYTFPGRIFNVGVEDVRGISDYNPAITSTVGTTNAYCADENHGWSFITVYYAANGWVRRVAEQYFGYACVGLNSGTKWFTVADCQALEPVSIITGERRYAFNMNGNSLCLVRNCYTYKDRHHYVTGANMAGPNAFVDCVSSNAFADAGPHQRWGTGTLWENINMNRDPSYGGSLLDVQNRGNAGSGHGWAGANCVVWNSTAANGFVVQNPPGAHNWLIGSIGTILAGTMYVGPHDPGTYDANGTNVFPQSLYYNQLQDRLETPQLAAREYVAGSFNNFTPTNSAGETVNVEAAWSAALASAGYAASNFDVVPTNSWVPFSFAYTLAGGEQVVRASLVLCLRGGSGAMSTNQICFDSVTNRFTFGALGWNVGTTSTVQVLDLAGQLALLGDGKFNVAVGPNVGVDWAYLTLHTAPVLQFQTNALLPVADAFVRGGTNIASNFGTNTTLTVKEDASDNNDRRALLRWDLSGVSGTVMQALVVLSPVTVGTSNIENAVGLVSNTSWNETSVAWTNQPAVVRRLASWVPVAAQKSEAIVTPEVVSALAGNQQLALEVFATRNFGNSGNVDYASREYGVSAMQPLLVLALAGFPPSISPIPDQTMTRDTVSSAIPFTVGDKETAASLLTMSGLSSRPDIVAPAGLAFGGAGSNRTLTITPQPRMVGAADITVTVNDGTLSNSVTFTVNVTPGNVVWTGAASTYWTNENNWAGGVVPGTNDAAIFYQAGASRRATLTGTNLSVYALAFANGAASADVKLSTNSPLTLLSGASVTAGNHSISGGGAGSSMPGELVIGSANFEWNIAAGASLTNAARTKQFSGTPQIHKTGDGMLIISGNSGGSGSMQAVWNIDAGKLRLTGSSAALGNSGNTVTVSEGATYELFAHDYGGYNGVFTLNGMGWNNSGALLLSSGNQALPAGAGSVVLGSDAAIAVETNLTLTVNNPVGGQGGLIKIGPGKLLLNSSNYNGYLGDTMVAQGTLALGAAATIPITSVFTVKPGAVFDVTAVTDGYRLFSDQTLTGAGTVRGNVTILDGALLSPGLDGIGTMVFSNDLTLAGTTVVELSKAGLAVTNDQLRCGGLLTYGGALQVTLSGTVAGGEVFPIFVAPAGALRGGFTNLDLPELPADLLWFTNNLAVNGTLSIMQQPKLANYHLRGTNLVLGASLGLPGQSSRLLSATNLFTPMSGWTPVSTNQFDASGNCVLTNPVNPALRKQFFRLAVP